MLVADEISKLLFSTDSGNLLVNLINKLLKSLVQNDNAFLGEDTGTPTIWECKWLNDLTVAGYAKGKGVWMNTLSPEEILNTRYSQVMQYVERNSYLKAMMSHIDPNDQAKMNKFLLKAIEGTASSNVSALYCLGNLADSVQIRVSLVDDNKALPTDDRYWYSFYHKGVVRENKNLMLSCLANALSSGMSTHIDEYHLSSLSERWMEENGFFKKDPFDVSTVKTLSFYDHTYCERMEGFDYVVKWRVEGKQWCRQWRSGYLEQGGFVQNTGDALLDVRFLHTYNYPFGQQFYLNGYDILIDDGDKVKVNSYIANDNRYMFTVTPILKAGSLTAYAESPTKIEDEASQSIYACVDVANISNSGFSVINLDKSVARYSKYSWYTAGYTVATNGEDA